MDNNTCVICNAGFPNSAMVGKKCIICNKLYPDAESGEELRQSKSKNKAETLTDVTVRKMIYEVLDEANIKRHKCEKCSALFYRTSPAQKICLTCRNNREQNVPKLDNGTLSKESK